MSLKFKRNYPIIFLLITFVSFLMLTMGAQPIISYTIKFVLGA